MTNKQLAQMWIDKIDLITNNCRCGFVETIKFLNSVTNGNEYDNLILTKANTVYDIYRLYDFTRKEVGEWH